MKRFLSMLLVIVLLAAAIPTAAFADRTSSITVTFKAFDADLDKAFRQWAGTVIDHYVGIYTHVYNDLLYESVTVMKDYSDNHIYRRTGWGTGDYEYDPYSLDYDTLYREDPKQAEELLELAYLEQLSESIQKHAAELKLGGFDNRDTGKWLTLDTTTGQWTYSYQLEAVTKMEQNKLIENTIDTAIKTIDGAVKVYNLAIVKGKDPNSTFNSLWKSAMSTAVKINDDIFEYLNNKLQDQLYVSLKKDIVNNIKFADDAAVTYLRKTYVESAEYVLKGTTDITEQDTIFPTQRKREIFKQSVDKFLAAYEAQKAEAQDIAEKIISGTETLDVQTLKAKCDGSKITNIIAIELLRSATKLVFEGVKENFNVKGWSLSKKKSAFGDVDTSAGWIVSSIYDALSSAADATCNVLIDNATSGTKITWSGWWDQYKKTAVSNLQTTLSNLDKEAWKDYGKDGRYNSSDLKKVVATEIADIVIDVIGIGADLVNGKETSEIVTKLEKVIMKALTYIAAHIAVNEATTRLGNTAKIADTLKKSVGEFLKAIDPASWADVGVGIVNTARSLHDAKSGNAAAEFTAFKMYQLWEVGSKGVQRGKAGFPTLQDANDPNKTTSDYLVQKVSQVLEQMNTDITCTDELITVLRSNSDLKKAVVAHFKEKGISEESLIAKLSSRRNDTNTLYEHWNSQQLKEYSEYFQ